MQVPVIHLNGTSRETLVEQAATTATALRAALVALDNAAPHPRDYYMKKGAYEMARAEYMARREKLEKMLTEFEVLSEYLALDPPKEYGYCDDPKCPACLLGVATHEKGPAEGVCSLCHQPDRAGGHPECAEAARKG